MSELWRLLKLFSSYKLWIIGGIFVSLASVLANIALMAISGWFIAAMGIAGVTGAAINYFTPAAIIRACAIIRTGGRYVDRVVTHEATFGIIARLRRWFYNHLEPLAPAVLSKERSGDVFSRLRGDIDVLERFYLNFLVPAVVGLLASVVITVVAYSYHPACAAITGIMLSVAGFFLPFIAYRLGKGAEEIVVDSDAQMRGELAYRLQGIGELLVYDVAGRYCAMDEMQYRGAQKARKQLNLMDLCAQNTAILCTNVAVLLMLIVAVYLAQKEIVSFPDVVMLTLLTLASYEAVQPLIPAARSLGGVMRAARRIFDITDRNAPVKDAGEGVLPHNMLFSLSFDDVYFGYDRDVPVFRNLSFEVKAGEKILIMGPSGVGKSSLINLILHFWEPQSGRISLYGQDLSEYRGEQLREAFSVVTQAPHLFERTLRDNLLIARPKRHRRNWIWHVREPGSWK